MSHANRCPDCGHWNDAGADHCAQCNHPLGEHAPRASRPKPAAPAVVGAEAGAAPVAPEATTAGGGPGFAGCPPPADEPLILRKRRRPRPRSADSQIVLQLWLIFGTVGVAVVLWAGIQGFHKENSSRRAVEGSTEAQQERANVLFEALARDSNNVDTHRMLGDVLYDTANWPDAIVHYRAAVRRDSSQVTAIVDLGVCYFNLGHPDEAERHFLLALARDPSQNVALFNLGIVNETRDQSEEALSYYHRALRTNPPEAMKDVLQQRISALMQKLGREAPPLPSGQ